jgi:hypothetical protein
VWWCWGLNSGPLSLLGRCSRHGSTAVPPALFCLSCFSGRVLCFCLGPASDCHPSTYASCIAGITSIYHHAWLGGLRWGVGLTNFFPRLTSNYNPPDFWLPSTWDYKCEPLYLPSIYLIFKEQFLCLLIIPIMPCICAPSRLHLFISLFVQQISEWVS